MGAGYTRQSRVLKNARLNRIAQYKFQHNTQGCYYHACNKRSCDVFNDKCHKSLAPYIPKIDIERLCPSRRKHDGVYRYLQWE